MSASASGADFCQRTCQNLRRPQRNRNTRDFSPSGSPNRHSEDLINCCQPVCRLGVRFAYPISGNERCSVTEAHIDGAAGDQPSLSTCSPFGASAAPDGADCQITHSTTRTGVPRSGGSPIRPRGLRRGPARGDGCVRHPCAPDRDRRTAAGRAARWSAPTRSLTP